jgi:hypothetical protein
MAGLLGPDIARQVLDGDDPQAATAPLQEALAARGLARTARPWWTPPSG